MLLRPLLTTLAAALTCATTTLAKSQLTPPQGALVVSKSGGGGGANHFSSIQAAVKAAKPGDTIFVHAGEYQEQVTVRNAQTNLTIIGETPDDTTYRNNRVTIFNSIGGSGGDDATAVLRLHADDTTLIGLDISNRHGPGAVALALSSSGDRQGFYACKFHGYQDTFLSDIGRRFIAASAAVGSTDFLFGRGHTVFRDCKISINLRPTNGYYSNAFVTAPGNFKAMGGQVSQLSASYASTPEMILLDRCSIEKAQGCSAPDGKAFLGRPWTKGARAVVQRSFLGSIVNAKGWAPWNDKAPRLEGTVFQEYGNYGPGAKGARAHMTPLDEPIGLEEVLGADYQDWVLKRYIK